MCVVQWTNDSQSTVDVPIPTHRRCRRSANLEGACGREREISQRSTHRGEPRSQEPDPRCIDPVSAGEKNAVSAAAVARVVQGL